MKSAISSWNWDFITSEINNQGFSLVSNVLTTNQCNFLNGLYDNTALYRKKVVMERHRFGLGEYKYFAYPLPQLLQSIRENIYPYLAPIANSWMNALRTNIKYPNTLKELHALCEEKDQTKPTVLILQYKKGGFNTLHQDLYGEVYFPIQMVLFLSDYGKDYSGGEFVLTEQTPRAQSKAIVLKPQKGDVLLFATNFRPKKGSRGYYRATMKHGVSEVQRGNRATLGIIFHDALN